MRGSGTVNFTVDRLLWIGPKRQDRDLVDGTPPNYPVFGPMQNMIRDTLWIRAFAPWDHRMRSALIAMASLLPLSGCGAPSVDSIIGNYEFDDGRVAEKIVIRSDHSFTVVSFIDDQFSFQLDGIWRPYRVDGGCLRVTLSPFRSSIRMYDETLVFRHERDSWPACFERGVFSGIYISINDDLGMHYRCR